MLYPIAGTDELAETELVRLYDYPRGLTRPWLATNFVSSVDGAVTVDGTSRGLSSPADKTVFLLGRDLADVILVGANTALVEGYRGVRESETRIGRRRAAGLSRLPPIAVVSNSGAIPPDSPLIVDTSVPPLVITTKRAGERRRDELAAAGADVVIAGDAEVDLRTALRALDERGLRRITCEGGPRLFGSVIAQDLVDELRLTVSPMLTAGDTGRIATGLPATPARLRLASAIHANDSLLLRYLRRDAPANR
ncbi:MAG: pyrimidine reductase family protein [Sciscionella sp.]|nr:pyrimidine reductase family protein [Sciscionella sp.]